VWRCSYQWQQMYECKFPGKLGGQVVRGAYLEVIFFVHKFLSQLSITARGRMQMTASGGLRPL